MVKTAVSADDYRPTLGPIKRHNGIAGNYAYSVTVQYPNEEPRNTVFYGSAYGSPGPVVIEDTFGQMFVTSPERFGPRLTADWVRAFFAA